MVLLFSQIHYEYSDNRNNNRTWTGNTLLSLKGLYVVRPIIFSIPALGSERFKFGSLFLLLIKSSPVNKSTPTGIEQHLIVSCLQQANYRFI